MRGGDALQLCFGGGDGGAADVEREGNGSFLFQLFESGFELVALGGAFGVVFLGNYVGH
jgi:hypothetical protein